MKAQFFFYKTSVRKYEFIIHFKIVLSRKNRKSLNGYVFPGLDKANQDDKRDLFRKSRNAARLFNNYLKQIATLADIVHD